MAPTAAVRFRREAEAAARLRSPHTVELYDFGVTDDGTLHLVMKLLEETNLPAWRSAPRTGPRAPRSWPGPWRGSPSPLPLRRFRGTFPIAMP